MSWPISRARSFSLGIAGNADIVVASDGSGDATLEGKADEVKLSIDGSGDVRAERLAARSVEVSIHGSGDARVNASDKLEARVAGSGDVLYRGHPQHVTRDIAGSGSVASAD